MMEVPEGWGHFDRGPARIPQAHRHGLLVVFAFDGLTLGQEPARLPQGRQGYPTDLNAYVHIGADGRSRAWSEDRKWARRDDLAAAAGGGGARLPCRP